MNQNANAILLLCSHMCVGEGVFPLEPREWTELAERLMQRGLEPADVIGASLEELQRILELSPEAAGRLVRLTERSGSLTFELSKYENIGIFPITRADREYPAILKKKLGAGCPPVFYYSGDLQLANIKAVGYVGSRSVKEDDISFTRQTVEKTVNLGYAVVSGGAKGIDSVAAQTALAMGGYAVEYLADSMLRMIKQSDVSRSVREGKRLLLSVVKPDAGFQTGIAMMRNRYIYAHSRATVVVKSDLNKGGTWAGAIDALKHGWSPVLCNNSHRYPGNAELIERGAIPIDLTWDGEVDAIEPPLPASQKERSSEQLSMFDTEQ